MTLGWLVDPRCAAFWIKYKAADFVARPLQLVHRLRALSDAEIRRRQDALERFRADLLYDTPPWRMGSHLLRAAAGCLHKVLTPRHVQRCADAAAKLRARLRPEHVEKHAALALARGGGKRSHVAGSGRDQSVPHTARNHPPQLSPAGTNAAPMDRSEGSERDHSKAVSSLASMRLRVAELDEKIATAKAAMSKNVASPAVS